MGILYNVPDLKTWGIMFFILVVLIALKDVKQNGVEAYCL